MYPSHRRQHQPNPRVQAKSKKHHYFRKIGLLLALVVLVGGAAYFFNRSTKAQSTALLPGSTVSSENTIKPPIKTTTPAVVSTNTTKSSTTSTTPPSSTACSNNSLSQLILVSISQRHLWACDTTSLLYQSAVVTGMENLPADLTPVGTYHIYAKETDTYLKGSDSTGSWDDYVYYWMPFLYNQYGAYGIHDATWRAASAFGNISPYSSDASHGCVETPLASATWLYNWSVIGTTVIVEA